MKSMTHLIYTKVSLSPSCGLASAAVLAIAILGLGCETENDHWRAAKGAGQTYTEHIYFLTNFIAHYPKSPHITEAREKLENTMDACDYQQLLTAQSYADYLKHHPKGEHVREVRDRLPLAQELDKDGGAPCLSSSDSERARLLFKSISRSAVGVLTFDEMTGKLTTPWMSEDDRQGNAFGSLIFPNGLSQSSGFQRVTTRHEFVLKHVRGIVITHTQGEPVNVVGDTITRRLTLPGHYYVTVTVELDSIRAKKQVTFGGDEHPRLVAEWRSQTDIFVDSENNALLLKADLEKLVSLFVAK